MGYAIAVNSAGNAFVTGATTSPNFPLTSGVAQSYYGGGLSDGFITELNTAATVWSIPPTSAAPDKHAGYSIVLDSSGDAYVTGSTYSIDFPLTNFFQPNHGVDFGQPDAFVVMLNGAGSGFTYSSYLGGNNYDWGYGIALDTAGDAFVTWGKPLPATSLSVRTLIRMPTLRKFRMRLWRQGSGHSVGCRHFDRASRAAVWQPTGGNHQFNPVCNREQWRHRSFVNHLHRGSGGDYTSWL